MNDDTALWDESKAAPHGRDESGVPLTPFGTNLDGSPRKSNRGARPGRRQGGTKRGRGRPRRATPGVKIGNTSDRQRKEALVSLADMFIVMPMAGVSASPQLAGKIGQRHAEALAGDAVIVSNYSPYLADGLIVLSQSKPGALAWLEKVEERAPYVMLVSVGMQMARALVENHLNPNPDLAAAGRVMGQIRAQQMADSIMAEAQAMGIPTSPADMPPQYDSPNGSEPTVPIHTAN